MALNIVAQILIGIALQVIAYAIMPKPKQPQPPETKDLEDPTVEAGRPIPVAFGSVRIQGLNLVWFGDKETVLREVKDTGGKK